MSDNKLAARIDEAMERIGKMCSEGRPPRMSIPVRPDDDDVFINDTLRECRAALAAAHEEDPEMSLLQEAGELAKEATEFFASRESVVPAKKLTGSATTKDFVAATKDMQVRPLDPREFPDGPTEVNLAPPPTDAAPVAITTQEVLAQAIHREWRDGMLRQDRHVSDERMEWKTLPAQDKRLDRAIASKLLETFSFGIYAHPEGAPIMVRDSDGKLHRVADEVSRAVGYMLDDPPEGVTATVSIIKREVLRFVQNEVEIDALQLRALTDVIDGASMHPEDAPGGPRAFIDGGPWYLHSAEGGWTLHCEEELGGFEESVYLSEGHGFSVEVAEAVLEVLNRDALNRVDRLKGEGDKT